MTDYQQKLADKFRDLVTADTHPLPGMVMKSDDHYGVSFVVEDRDMLQNPLEPCEALTTPPLESLAKVINDLGKPVAFALLPNMQAGRGIARQDNLISDTVCVRHSVFYDGSRFHAGHVHMFDVMVLT